MELSMLARVLRHLRRPLGLSMALALMLGCRDSGPQAQKPDSGPTAQTQTAPTGTTATTPSAQTEAEPAAQSGPDAARGVGDQSPEQPAPGPADAGGVPTTEGTAAKPNGQAGTPPPTSPATEPAEPIDLQPSPEAKVDLGPPLVDDPSGLKPLDPARPVWIDTKNRRVVMVGQVCQTEALLEMFACLKDTKEHEAVVTVDVKAYTVHAGLLAVGARPGHPAQWDPVYKPAAGTEIEVTVIWKDHDGKVQRARAQDWIRNIQTKKAMDHPWVFAGSGFWIDEQTGQRRYQAEGGDFICVSNFTTAMLDLPIESSQANESLMFDAFTERIPPRGTSVTLVLTPRLLEPSKEAPRQPGQPT